MKKVLCLVIAMCLILGVVTVLAEGNTLSREELFDQIEALANKNGLTVYRNGANLAVQNGASYFAISNDDVAYMENGMLKKESIYVDGARVKDPEAAVEAFFGAESGEEAIDKSAHDKEIASYDEYNVMGIVEQWETPYGTLIHTGTKGVMHGSFYNLSLIRWNGTYLGITKDAPQMNQWTNAPWDELEISDDGKMVKVTYHGNVSNFVIEANFETGEVISGEKPIEYDYTIDKDKLRVTINAYKGSSKKVVIPDEIEGMPVEIIATAAFNHCDSVQEVVISKNVFEIANRAFEHCKNLKTVTFLNPYTYIAEGGYTYVYSKNAPPYVPHGFKEPEFPGFYDCAIEMVYGYEGSTAEKYFAATDFKALEGKGKAGREYASIEDMANFIQASIYSGVSKAVFTRKNVVLTIKAGEKQAEISYLDNYDMKTFELEEVSKTASHVYIKDVLRAFDLIENTQESFVYNENDGCISIKKYTGSAEKVVVPSEIDGMPVTKIGTGAFLRCETLKELIIPESVQKIDHMAVVECVNLEATVILNPYVYIADVDMGYVYEEGRPPYTPHGVMMKYPAFMDDGGVVYGYRNSTADEYFGNFMPLEENGERKEKMIESYALAQKIEAELVKEEGGFPNVQIVKDGVTISMRAGETEVTKTNWSGETIETINWDTAVEHNDGKYYVPIDELMEAFGLLSKGSNLVPIVTLFDKLGISGSYGNGDNAIEATRGNTHLYFYTGDMRAFVNGEAVVWENAAEGTYPDYYVPADDVMKAFKLHLEFNPVTNEVDVIEE